MHFGDELTISFCYLDEAGSAETLQQQSASSTPVFVIGGLIVDHNRQLALVRDFLELKRLANPSRFAGAQLSDLISAEIKGSDLRSDIRSQTRRRERAAIGFFDKVLKLLETHRCRVVARIIVKNEGEVFNDAVVYPQATRWLCSTFHEHLVAEQKSGIVVLDSRTKVKNVPNTVGVLTQRLRSRGDQLPRLLDSPVFGHSDTHVVLQIADILVSGLIFPIACAAYCGAHTWNAHTDISYQRLRNRYGAQVKGLQFRYQSLGEWRGGLYPTSSNG